MLDRKFADERVQELLKVAHLDGFEDRHPWELSGGMRQRVAICRTLLHDPRILLMDEPFGALDALTRDKMGRFLEDIRDVRGVNSQTVIFITHSIPEAVFLGDRVVVMTSRPGRIADIIDIKLPRPRRSSVRESAEFSQYLRRIRGYFEEEGE
jgi:NitT/TauT family transport system ATP-binding protein